MESKRRRWYTVNEVAAHNHRSSCWAAIWGRVLDLTPLVSAPTAGTLAKPILDHAGQDISHWFDEATRGVKTHVDPALNLRVPYLPHGRFLHVPPSLPVSNWATDFGTPWWQDEQYVIGRLSAKSKRIRVANVLTKQEHLLEVCEEETLQEVLDRYLDFNAHAGSYTWKALQGDEFVPLDMDKTLAENHVADESGEFAELGISEDFFIPVLHLYFNDDLTVA